MKKTLLLPLLACCVLTACDQVNQRLGIEDPAKKEAEGKAVGSACRHSGRAIEDCYSIYSWLTKSSIYAGWREMDAYMRENQLETIPPQLPPPEPPQTGKKKKATPAAEKSADGDKPAEDKAEASDKAEKPADTKH